MTSSLIVPVTSLLIGATAGILVALILGVRLAVRPSRGVARPSARLIVSETVPRSEGCQVPPGTDEGSLLTRYGRVVRWE